MAIADHCCTAKALEVCDSVTGERKYPTPNECDLADALGVEPMELIRLD
jgi:hypothetical protein